MLVSYECVLTKIRTHFWLVDPTVVKNVIQYVIMHLSSFGLEPDKKVHLFALFVVFFCGANTSSLTLIRFFFLKILNKT